MAYINIVFQNMRKSLSDNPLTDDISNEFTYYTKTFLENVNVMQANIGVSKLPTPDEKANLNHGASAFFFTESPSFLSFYRDPSHALPNWRVLTPIMDSYPNYGFHPCTTKLNAVLKGLRSDLSSYDDVADITWFAPVTSIVNRTDRGQIIRTAGTGVAVPGSDRYAIKFDAKKNYFTTDHHIHGIFVHIKNTNSSPGLQLAALCKANPHAIIFGDLNLDLNKVLKHEALEDAISNTHKILAIKQEGDFFVPGTPSPPSTKTARGRALARSLPPIQEKKTFRTTRFKGALHSSCLDYALVPINNEADIKLGAYRVGEHSVVPHLERKHSDHSTMLLQIKCRD